MKKLLFCFFLFFISANSLFAQQSIGFTNPDSIQPLLDYRLPDWGYSNFYVDFDANGNGFDQKSFSDKQVQKSGTLRLIPVYNLYRESEKRIFLLNTKATISLGGEVDKFESDESESREGRFDTQINLFLNLKKYVTERSFIYGASPARFDYRGENDEAREEGSLTDKQLSINRVFSTTPRLGYGFGRVRNVNPVIRAIRLKERADVLNSGLDFNRQDILRAADQFTRYDGYQQTYDRPAKHFWSDMGEDDTNVNLGSLDTFDMLYLTDVLDEAIGTRLEGWEVIGGMEFDYQNYLRRTEDQFYITDYQKTIDKEIGGFLNGRWYKNTSLKQQWGLFGETVLSYPLGKDEQDNRNTKRNFVINTGLEWLWNVTDRILFQTSLIEYYRRNKIETTSEFSGTTTEFTEWSNRVSLIANLNFFVENQTVINISAVPSLNHFGNTENDEIIDDRRFKWIMRIGVRYYFSRNLY